MNRDVDKPRAPHGTSAVIFALLGLLTLGLLSPIGLVLGLFGLRHPQPRTRAIIAVILGGLGTLTLPVTVIAVLVFAWGFTGYRQSTTAATYQPGDVEVGIVGQQYVWTSVYPGPDGVLWTGDDVEKQGEIILPEHTRAYITIQSKDVLHCLFIPAARAKKDAVPGRMTSITLDPMAVGEYEFFCTEYCGIDHSQMTGTLRVVTQSDFDAETSRP